MNVGSIDAGSRTFLIAILIPPPHCIVHATYSPNGSIRGRCISSTLRRLSWSLVQITLPGDKFRLKNPTASDSVGLNCGEKIPTYGSGDALGAGEIENTCTGGMICVRSEWLLTLHTSSGPTRFPSMTLSLSDHERKNWPSAYLLIRLDTGSA